MSQLFAEVETKTNIHILAKINQQEASNPVIVSRLRAAGVQWERLWTMKTSKTALFRTLLKEVRRIFRFWRICWYFDENKKVDKRLRYRILTVLAAFQPWGAHHQGPQQAHENPGAEDEHFYNKYCKNYGVGGLEVQSYVKRRGHSCRRQARGRRTGSRRTSRRCGTRRSGLSAHLTTAFWTILCMAFLSHRSV